MLAAKGLLREALDRIGWDPPRIMGTAFMFYLMGFDKFEGWVGIDQFAPTNRWSARFLERFRARYGEDPPMCPTRSHCSRTTPRACSWRRSCAAPILSVPASRRASSRSGSCRAPPVAHRPTSPCSPYEHGMFRGDWLLYGRVTNGQLEFEGLFEQWED